MGWNASWRRYTYLPKIVLPSFHKNVINVSWKSWIEECAFRNNLFHCIVSMITWSVYEFLLSCLHGLLFSFLQICVDFRRFSSHFTSFCLSLFHIFVKWNVFFKKTLRISLKDIQMKNWSKYCWANFCNFMLMCRFKNCQRKNQPPDGSKEFA